MMRWFLDPWAATKMLSGGKKKIFLLSILLRALLKRLKEITKSNVHYDKQHMHMERGTSAD
jgi:hypothetical protein